MNDSISGGIQDPVGGTAHRVAGGVHNAVDHAERMANQAHDSVGEVRGVIRAQPITAALVVFAMGYLFGRLGSLIPSSPLRRR